MTTFQLVHSSDHISETADLAHEIWQEYYGQIIGQKQVDYMLEKFQSESAITEQLGKGYEYYLAAREGPSTGYLAVIPEKGQPKLMISKLYLRKTHRGSGVGKEML